MSCRGLSISKILITNVVSMHGLLTLHFEIVKCVNHGTCCRGERNKYIGQQMSTENQSIWYIPSRWCAVTITSPYRGHGWIELHQDDEICHQGPENLKSINNIYNELCTWLTVFTRLSARQFHGYLAIGSLFFLLNDNVVNSPLCHYRDNCSKIVLSLRCKFAHSYI